MLLLFLFLKRWNVIIEPENFAIKYETSANKKPKTINLKL